MIKKIFLNIAVIAFVVFVLDFTIGRTLRYLYFNETSGFHYNTTFAMEKTEADILVIGASGAMCHYVPEVFEDSLKMTFYNTGRAGSGILFQTAILRSALKRYTPELIVLDYSDDENPYGWPSSILPYYRTHEEVREIIDSNNPTDRIKLISEIYPFNSQILAIIIGNLEINKTRYTDNKGYTPLYNEWEGKLETDDISPTHEPDSAKLNAFYRFINTAKKSGAGVIVIHSPVFKKKRNSRELEMVTDICKVENVPFWNFSQDTLFLNNGQLFQDVGHLNNNGAKIFSNLVVDKIKHAIDITRNIKKNY